MTHIMLDLETWGTAPGCALRSIGAVAFGFADRPIDRTFYRNISKQSCLDAGLIIDPDTEHWWSRQSHEAQAAIMSDPRHLLDVVDSFHDWFIHNGDLIWSHGANFDEPIWTAAAKAVGRRVPWKYWNVRDTRTIYALADIDTNTRPRSGIHHNALDDALHQARLVQMAWARLRPSPTATVPVYDGPSIEL